MATHGVTSVRTYFADVLRYTNADTVTRVACPTFVTDNETDEVSTGQGKVLFEHLTCPKEFRLFKKEEGAEGHCEGMAPIVFWDAHSTGLTHCCRAEMTAAVAYARRTADHHRRPCAIQPPRQCS